jgi:hypothetical protein
MPHDLDSLRTLCSVALFLLHAATSAAEGLPSNFLLGSSGGSGAYQLDGGMTERILTIGTGTLLVCDAGIYGLS